MMITVHLLNAINSRLHCLKVTELYVLVNHLINDMFFLVIIVCFAFLLLTASDLQGSSFIKTQPVQYKAFRSRLE